MCTKWTCEPCFSCTINRSYHTPNLLIGSPLAMQIETKIELARVKVMLQFLKDQNKLASNICLSSHFPSSINIQTGDLCNCDSEL